MFVGVSAAGSGRARAGGGGWRSASGTRRGGAVGAVAALPTARGAQRLSHSVALAPSSARQSSGPTRLVLPRFSKGARRRPAPRCPRLTPGRTLGATPSTSSATRARARDRAAKRRARRRKRPTSRVRGRRRWRLGRWWTLRDRPRRRPPRRAPSTGPRRRDSSVARAELLEMERRGSSARETKRTRG